MYHNIMTYISNPAYQRDMLTSACNTHENVECFFYSYFSQFVGFFVRKLNKKTNKLLHASKKNYFKKQIDT